MRGVGGEGEKRCLAVGGADTFVLVDPFEEGGESGVLRDDHDACAVGVAVVPAGETVVLVWRGGEGGGVVRPVVAAAGHLPLIRSIGLCNEAQGYAVGEEGGEEGVLREEDSAWVVGVAVVPAAEPVAGGGHGGDATRDVGGEPAGAVYGAPCGVAANDVKVVEVGDGEEWTPLPVVKFKAIASCLEIDVGQGRRVVAVNGKVFRGDEPSYVGYRGVAPAFVVFPVATVQ